MYIKNYTQSPCWLFMQTTMQPPPYTATVSTVTITSEKRTNIASLRLVYKPHAVTVIFLRNCCMKRRQILSSFWIGKSVESALVTSWYLQWKVFQCIANKTVFTNAWIALHCSRKMWRPYSPLGGTDPGFCRSHFFSSLTKRMWARSRRTS